MFSTARRTVATVAALGALALGGSAIAGAAQNGASTTTGAASATPSGRQGQPPNGGRPGGRHVGANGKTEQALTGDTAAKVKAAALKKVAGGTVERVETDVDHGSPYEAHVTKSDGTQVEVLVNKSFEVTAVNAMQHP
jgi:hypothetical protein